jgi:hypothetical protein
MYGNTEADVHAFMEELGYTATFLAEDHERHFMYEPL